MNEETITISHRDQNYKITRKVDELLDLCVELLCLDYQLNPPKHKKRK